MRLFIGALTLVSLSAFSVADAHAAHRYDRRTDNLATAIERAADEVKHEVDQHLRDRHDYARLRAISRVIEEKADHVERIVDQHESPNHIYADLTEIDRNVHAFEQIVRESDRHASRHGEPRYEKMHVHDELSRLTDLIHQLRDHLNYGQQQARVGRPVVVPQRRPAFAPRPVVVRRPVSRGGITFGGQWGSVHVNF